MFDSLKKKISSFFKKEEKILEEKIEEAEEETFEQIGEPVIPEKPTPLIGPAKPKPTKEYRPKLTMKTKVKAFVRKAKISEKDLEDLLSDFNLALLEADVAVPVADEICDKIKQELVGKEISRKDNIRGITHETIRKTLEDILIDSDFNLITKVSSKKPYIMLFLGPNGHGKSTTIGKLAHYLHKHKLSSVIAASDTFRAASIEQLEKIGAKAGVRVIKHRYGSDPAAVSWDTVKHAEARGIDVVLIDTAGRSELDKNLMEELKKINRVIKPDLKIYVSEALAGNAAVDEAKKFNDFIDLDGIIMTKVDTDVKGGSILSVSYITGKPILFLGVGQDMNDLKPFDKKWFINKILS